MPLVTPATYTTFYVGVLTNAKERKQDVGVKRKPYFESLMYIVAECPSAFRDLLLDVLRPRPRAARGTQLPYKDI